MVFPLPKNKVVAMKHLRHRQITLFAFRLWVKCNDSVVQGNLLNNKGRFCNTTASAALARTSIQSNTNVAAKLPETSTANTYLVRTKGGF